MSAEGGGGEQVVVNRAIISTWETFKVGPILCQLKVLQSALMFA
jgi:hypothetical protein